jgi:DNA-directed RNA polymerase subunit beta
MSDRINFGKLKEVIAPPNLIQNQLDSYMEFLQKDVPANQRKTDGLEAVFSEVFPIESYDGRCVLEYVSYNVVGPKSTTTTRNSGCGGTTRKTAPCR